MRRTLATFRTGAEERELRDKYLQRLVKLDEAIEALDQQGDTLTARAQALDAALAAELERYEEK